jgi:hypothetical protein
MDDDVIYRDYDALLAMALRWHQLTLFSLDGTEMRLDYERHVGDFGGDFVWRSEEERIQFQLQLAIDVLCSWEIHIRQSSYSLPHFGAVHLPDDWLTAQGRSPPCAVMRNAGFVDPSESPAALPLSFSFRSERLLGSLATFVCEDRAEVGRYWRVYILSDLKRLEPDIEARVGPLLTYPLLSAGVAIQRNTQPNN